MTDLLQGQDIAALLRSVGPVVKCVLLRATNDDDDRKQSANNDNDTDDNQGEQQRRQVLVDWIEEMEIDTTPKKSMVSKILGGPFTFLGQYEQEGIVLMVRRDQSSLPRNPHQLQPPLDDAEVRGDILVLRVAPTEEVLDVATGDEKVEVPSNDEFFLNYTKDEYVQFASRTDIVAPPPPQENEGEEEGEEVSDEEEESSEEEEEDANDEDYNIEDDLEEEDDQVGMMNLLMGHVLREFHERHGRGPDTAELLNLRSALAQKLGVEVPPQDEQEDWDEKAVKKKKEIINDNDGDSSSPTKSILIRKRTVSTQDLEDEKEDAATPDQDAKRVKFSHSIVTEENDNEVGSKVEQSTDTAVAASSPV